MRSALLAALREALERSGQIAKAAERGYDTDNIYFHATDAPKDFRAFRRRLGDIGIHFGTLGQAEDRLRFMRGRRGDDAGGERIYPVFLRKRRPLRLRHDPGAFNMDNMPFTLGDDLDRAFGEYRKATRYSNTRNRWHANSALAELRDWLESRGYDSLVYRNTGEVAETPLLQAAREEGQAALEAMIARQRRLGKSVSAYDMDDQASPEYLRHMAAYRELSRLREAAQEDSVAVFRPNQIKSVFARDFDWRNSDMLRAALISILGGGAALLGSEPSEAA